MASSGTHRTPNDARRQSGRSKNSDCCCRSQDTCMPSVPNSHQGSVCLGTGQDLVSGPFRVRQSQLSCSADQLRIRRGRGTAVLRERLRTVLRSEVRQLRTSNHRRSGKCHEEHVPHELFRLLQMSSTDWNWKFPQRRRINLLPERLGDPLSDEVLRLPVPNRSGRSLG